MRRIFQFTILSTALASQAIHADVLNAGFVSGSGHYFCQSTEGPELCLQTPVNGVPNTFKFFGEGGTEPIVGGDGDPNQLLMSFNLDSTNSVVNFNVELYLSSLAENFANVFINLRSAGYENDFLNLHSDSGLFGGALNGTLPINDLVVFVNGPLILGPGGENGYFGTLEIYVGTSQEANLFVPGRSIDFSLQGPSAVPEPGGTALVGIGLAALAVRVAKARRAS